MNDYGIIDLKKEYKQFVPIEALVAAQINRIAEYRSKNIINLYEEAVDMLIDLLPPELEEKALDYQKKYSIEYDLSQSGKDLWVSLFRYIKKQLAKENIVWKRSRGYEVGHD